MIFSCRQGKEEALPPRAVEVVRPKLGEVAQTLEFPSRVEGGRSVTLSFNAMGMVADVFADLGDRVEAGQVLARLDARAVRAQTEAARAALEAARHKLQLMQKGARSEELARLRAQLAAAEEGYRVAKKEYERARRLYEEGVIPRARLDQAGAALKQAQANLEAARRGLEMAEKGAREEELRLQRDQVSAAAASYRSLLAKLKDFELRAPFAGTVTKRMVEVGQFVSPGIPAYELVEDERQKVRFETSLEKVGQLAEGMGVKIVGRERTVPGHITRISSAASPTTGLYGVEVVPDGEGLRAGEPVTVRARVVLARQVLTLPRRAVLSIDQNPRVLVVEDGVVKERQVSLGVSGDGLVEIRQGLAEGELVVLSGQEMLSVGEKVKPVEAEGKTQANPQGQEKQG